MAKRVSATDAKNNFGGLLEEVSALGRVDVVRHGRLVAVVMSPRAFHALSVSDASGAEGAQGALGERGKTHMIPAELARAAGTVKPAGSLDEELPEHLL